MRNGAFDSHEGGFYGTSSDPNTIDLHSLISIILNVVSCLAELHDLSIKDSKPL